MCSSSRGVSDSSLISALGSLPRGCRSAVFGRTCGMTAKPEARSLGTSALPTAPVAPATRTVITGAGIRSMPELLPPSGLALDGGVDAHLSVDAFDVPAGQGRQ